MWHGSGRGRRRERCHLPRRRRPSRTGHDPRRVDRPRPDFAAVPGAPPTSRRITRTRRSRSDRSRPRGVPGDAARPHRGMASGPGPARVDLRRTGDTYAGSGGSGGDYLDGGPRAGQNGFTGSARRDRAVQPREWAGGGDDWPPPKSLCMIPEAYRMALAYGRCPLTGIESPAGRWKVRNVVRWCRPNPPVGALGDKFRRYVGHGDRVHVPHSVLRPRRRADAANRTGSGLPEHREEGPSRPAS